MKQLNQTAQRVFDKLITGLNEPGDSRRIDNCDGAFMPVHVDLVWETSLGPIYSIAHYYKQNGDLMRDPEMTFLHAQMGVYPLTFTQDSVGLYQEAATVEGDQVRRVPKLQAQLTRFANTWLRNIREQQKPL